MSRSWPWITVVACLGASAAVADIAPSNAAQCRDKQAGAKCTLDEGGAGTCQERFVTRPDYSNGPPPTYRQVKMMVCVAAATKKSAVEPWGLALAALGVALVSLVVRLRRAGALAS